MVEKASIRDLFQVGLTREQFIDKYTELKEQATPDNTSSIFSNKLSSVAIGAIFDTVDTTRDSKIDENEIKALSNLDTEDGEDTLSDSDIGKLYEKTINQITEEYGTTNPEEMYNKAVKSGNHSQYEYSQSISAQIEIINELISAKNIESENKIARYQMQIDDLIKRSTKISTKTKEEYNDASEKLKQEKKYLEIAQQKSEEIHDKMLNTKAEIEHLKNKNKEDDAKKISSLETEYNNDVIEYAALTNQIANYSDSIKSLQKTMKDIENRAIEEDKSIKAKMTNLNKQIDSERASSASEIENYNQYLTQLNDAQEYALAQPTDEPTDDYNDGDTSNFSYDAAELKAKWAVKGEPQFSDGFYNKVVEISKRIGCDPNALMAVMKSESGLKTTAVNKNGGATGLIQFMPATAKAMGTSTDALKKMSPEEQLVYVEKYLTQNKKSAGFKDGDKLDAGTLYTLVFLPAYAKRDVLAISGTKYYKYNAGLDMNHDGQITKADMNKRVQKYMK